MCEKTIVIDKDLFWLYYRTDNNKTHYGAYTSSNGYQSNDALERSVIYPNDKLASVI